MGPITAVKSPSVDRMRNEMRSLFERAAHLDIRDYEEESADVVAERLSASVAELLDRALEICGELSASTDATSALSVVVNTADLAFMAGTELRTLRQRLTAHTQRMDSWGMVCDCGRALRKVQKSMHALDVALCEAHGLSDPLVDESELATSLRVRKEYARMWRFVGAVGAANDDLHAVLRGAGTICAILVGRDIYRRLRERDRYQLRQLQKRILNSLGSDPFDQRTAARLWEDWAGFVEMLRQVNNREELVQHDAACLERLARQLGLGRPVDVGSLTEELRSLRGLDDTLDVLALTQPLPLGELRTQVELLRGRYVRPAPTSAPLEGF